MESYRRRDMVEYTEVRRKKASMKPNGDGITAFFVTNVPQAARKSELREVFSRYGRLRDVYIGVNKGKNGYFYAFIRFADMKDVIAMERLLNGAKIRGRNLAVNLARYERKKKEVYETKMPLKTCNQPPQKTLTNAYRDHRSYAEIIIPQAGHKPPQPPPLP
ncbi:unnamed protein product [Lactuca virosa]|uniref:RRM domain-containing protein n=1 Tax=Lactuca virosa TaxID=75947 RepID=A0AAU9NA10_9ASTR|nr:unnamed protein product [Lactuca virosa]